MSIDALKARLPEYAKDLRLNIGSVLTTSSLKPHQAWGSAVAAAYAARQDDVTRAIVAEAAQHVDEATLNAAKAAGAIMGMNNVYYRTVHLSGIAEFKKMPARLRMNIIGNPGVDKVDFELWSLAASAVNGCGMCIEAHEREVQSKGMTTENIQDAVRIAAVIHAVATVLDAENALS
ncbi:carboxymuconolactone decarboxylase family protein [Indioceanicola profundi]|uniref:carboxymuconolactone decarboxylase family protein n=1 Tax=Indioceanicola profundi TaxID=2220096 RepID=UPI000E6AA656|nr:carboxymuconolactone decarboxylase family protein [Indioceanicola profundi]